MVARAARDRIGNEARIPRLTLGVALVGLALASAACGGSSPGPSVAGLATTSSASGKDSTATATRAGSAARSFVPYATCLTAHGIAASSPGGHGISITGNIDPSSPQFAAAQKACRKLAPTGGPRPLTAAQQALRLTQLIAFSQCMRTHGVPTFPDPSPNPNAFPFGGDAPALLGSPIGRTAFEACDSDFPKVGPQLRIG